MFQSDEALLKVGRKLTPEFYGAADWVRNDLFYAALSRAVTGADNGFFDLVFLAYASGGLPCGWTGEFPKAARPLAYYPRLPPLAERPPAKPSYDDWLRGQRSRVTAITIGF